MFYSSIIPPAKSASQEPHTFVNEWTLNKGIPTGLVFSLPVISNLVTAIQVCLMNIQLQKAYRNLK